MKQMSQKQRYIKTLAGLQIQLGILLSAIITAYGYAWMSHMKINDTFIVTMLRFFIAFADLGMFLAIGYMVDFKRGVVIGYVYKILAFLQTKQTATASEWDFVFSTVGKSFGLMMYYKVMLFLIIYTASYIVEIDHEEALVRKQQEDEERQKLMNQEKEKMFSQRQREQMHPEQKVQRKKQEQKASTEQTIKRIKMSLRYHKEDEFYKKMEIFFFVFYNSVCILTLFPLQQHVLDFSKALNFSQLIDFFQQVSNFQAINQQVIWYMNFQTIWNVVMFWVVILVGEFWVKSRYPAMIKQYLLGVPWKFLLMQAFSLTVLINVLILTPISSSIEQLNKISLLNLVNYEIFGVAFIIHSLLPLFISFLLLRLYLGLTHYLNRLVSRKYTFHSNSDDDNSNLDAMIYECVIQDDINKVRHFRIKDEELLSRHKLKRYTDEQRLKHYVDQETILQVQSLFEDHLVLDFYNKLSRYLSIWIFYLTLAVFLVSLNINDTYFATEDQFFVHVPAILLWLGMFFVFKYESAINLFYPKPLVYLIKALMQWLADRKAYNFVRLVHFYAIIFLIWLYRIYSEMFLPTHLELEERIKHMLYGYYSTDSIVHSGLMSQLLTGWAKYYTTHSSSCDYDLTQLFVDSLMIGLIILQLLTHKYFTPKSSKGNPILMILKLITPVYALFVFVINMECLQWGRVNFCCCLCIGVAFMHVNEKQLQRGITRNDDGEMREKMFDSMY